MKPLNIGVVGLGTVGSGTVKVLLDNAEQISQRAGRSIQVVHVGARRDHPDVDMSAFKVSRDVAAVVVDSEVDVVVELIGGTTLAKDLVLSAIEHGKHVVTANKALIAEYGNEIFSAAAEKGVVVAYEAAVAGGIPIIKALREGLASNQIEWLAGIINGTGNFILTEMRDKGRAFEDVLKEAQELGYAEADPTFDVEGIDAAHKLTILASIAFGVPLQFDRAYTEGIGKLTTEDVEYASELGYTIKHLGLARKTYAGVELRVHPTLIPKSRLIANVDGVMNAVVVHGNAVGPTLYYGPGAGSLPTASAVVSDLVDVARIASAPVAAQVPALGFQQDQLQDVQVLPVEQIETAYYLRVMASDESGVLARITGILSSGGINIEAILQKPVQDHEQLVPIIILTQTVREQDMNKVLEQIQALDEVKADIMRIRLETLDAE